MTVNEILKKYWGYDSFRPLQEEIINSVLQGCDTLALLPTGGGKSICYQVPALMQEGLCLVVSPLISLMKDQVQQLCDRGIKAACLVSGLHSYEQDVLLNNCIHGKIKLLYVSPERLRQRVFIEHFRQMKVSLIAVDEAHCISQWGYDFRPPYLEIAGIRQFHKVPVLALTATATPEVAEDIRRKLLFGKGSRFFQSSFQRGNLSYMVIREKDKYGRLLRIARTVGGSGIVYVRSRRRTREVAQYLTANGCSAGYYHAGLTARERDLSQAQWMKGEVQVMVATNAFGMGIDKSDVRFVAHLDIPSTMEAYFQEAGRAGRDGKQAYAVLLYDEEDLAALQRGFDLSYPSRQQITNVYRAVCNYYQLPVGSGTDCRFDFDIEAICAMYHFQVTEFYSATRFLEREGLIQLPELEEAVSKLYIPIDKETLYRFQVEHPRHDELLRALLRMYGGLFTEFVPISERAIARRIYLDEETISNMLRHLEALNVLVYQRKSDKPQIIFSAPRMDVKELYLSDANYKDQKQRAQERMDAMRRYVMSDDTCRSCMLVGYFGEEQSEPCGTCDVCRRQNGKSDEGSLRGKILALLKGQPMRAEELLLALPEIDESAVKQMLRTLVDEQRVSVNQQLKFFV